MATQAEKRAKVEEQVRGMAEWDTLYQTYNAIFKVTELALLSENLSLPQLHLLSVLKQNGGILTTGEIARAVVKASQTMTGVVDRLEDQGLVERRYDRSDRRKVWVHLTEKGERRWEDSMPAVNRLVEEVFSVLTDEQLRELQAQTDKLRKAAMGRLAEALERPGF